MQSKGSREREGIQGWKDGGEERGDSGLMALQMVDGVMAGVQQQPLIGLLAKGEWLWSLVAL